MSRPDRIEPVTVISDAFWKSALGGVDAAVGQTVVVNGVSVTVIGIAPPGFVGIWTDVEPDVWLPLTLQTALGYLTNANLVQQCRSDPTWIADDRIAWLTLVGRVRPANLHNATALLQAANHRRSERLCRDVSEDGPGAERHARAHAGGRVL